MSSHLHSITTQVSNLVGPILDGLGYELVDVAYASDFGRWILRLYIDKATCVTIDDCARVSREIGDLIDVKEIIDHEYVLEVSSPGLNRPLRKEKHFNQAIGKKIKVKTKTPVDGRRNYTGCLSRFEDGILYLQLSGEVVSIPLPNVEKANIIYEFD